MKKEELTYKIDYINTVDTLAGICEQLIIENKDECVKIRANNDAKSCMFMMSAPSDYFKFSCENLCVLNWSKFSKYFNVFTNSTTKEQTQIQVQIDEESGEAKELDMSSNKRPAEISYRLGNIDVIKHPVIKDKPNFPDFISTLKLSKEQIKELMSMISLFESDNMLIKLNETECEIEISNKMTKNCFSQKYTLETGYNGVLELNVMPSIFTLLPTEDYEIGFSSQGLIKFNQQREDDISLQLYLVSTKK